MSSHGALSTTARSPAVLICFPLEASPHVLVDVLDEQEATRLDDWINTHADYLGLIGEAHRLAESERPEASRLDKPRAQSQGSGRNTGREWAEFKHRVRIAF